MRILALGGSLRAGSWNRALLDEAAALAPTETELDLSQLAVIGSLPLFNQDIEERDGVPPAVAQLKDALRAADGLLIATPAYNWGIPGFLKNAVDWASPAERHTARLRRLARRARWRRWALRHAGRPDRLGRGVPLPEDAAVVRSLALRRPLVGAVRPGQPSD